MMIARRRARATFALRIVEPLRDCEGPVLELELALVAGQLHDIGGARVGGRVRTRLSPHFEMPPGVVDLSRLMASAAWNQPQISATSLDRRDARRIVDPQPQRRALSVGRTPGMAREPAQQASEALVIARLMSASIAATAVITAVRAAINPRMAAERPAIPSLA